MKRNGGQILKAALGDLNLLLEELGPTGGYTDKCQAGMHACMHNCLEKCVSKFA